MSAETKRESVLLGLFAPRVAQRLRELAAWECMPVAQYCRRGIELIMGASEDDIVIQPDRPPLGGGRRPLTSDRRGDVQEQGVGR
jgi:hypothetical protein